MLNLKILNFLNFRIFFLYDQGHWELAMAVKSAETLGWFCNDLF